MTNKKKTVLIIGAVILALIVLMAVMTQLNKEPAELKELPKPEISGGMRGELGIDKNINETVIDQYLKRPDAVYRDMRMLEDPATYENIGGDRFLSGYVKGFEVVPLPYIIPVKGLPEEVGETYSGKTLFSKKDGVYVPNYEESMSIIEELFPKDKVIFLMCGGGGYAGMTKDFLVSMGWDGDKIYVVGGYWYYEGKNGVEVKKKADGTGYDFSKVPYHEIDFSKLTETSVKPAKADIAEIKLSTYELELEQYTSFKLKAIVLPNEAASEIVYWMSDDYSIAYPEEVTDSPNECVIKALQPGTTSVTIQNEDGDLQVACKVTVTPREVGDPIQLDDLSEEAKEFAENDPNAIMNEFYNIDIDMEKAAEEGYYTVDEDGGYTVTDLWQKEYQKAQEATDKAVGVRTEIFNKLIDEKKTFVVLIYTKDCDGREYTLVEGAEKILKENNVPYFYTSDATAGSDMSLYNSRMSEFTFGGATIVIFKDGEIFASIDPNVDTIKSDEEALNWLKKYIVF